MLEVLKIAYFVIKFDAVSDSERKVSRLKIDDLAELRRLLEEGEI